MVKKNQDDQIIIMYFLQRNYQLSPEALQLIKKRNIPLEKTVEFIIQQYPTSLIINESMVIHALEASKYSDSLHSTNLIDNNQIGTENHIPEKNSEIAQQQNKFEEFKVISNIPKRTPSKGGDIKDFMKLFKDRYEKLKRILLSQPNISGPISSNKLKFMKGQEIEFIGMVSELRETPDGAVRISVEDPFSTNQIQVFSKRKSDNSIPNIIFEDSVIWIRGKLTKTAPNFQMIAYEITKPGIPVYGSSSLTRNDAEPSYLALLSDLHFGNKDFDYPQFKNFISFLHGKFGNSEYKKIAAALQVIIIAGDLVDGVGVFPGQEEELTVTNLIDQYYQVSELLQDIPPEIKVIAIPGNHDATRLALPQPPILREFAQPLYDLKNVTMLGNPTVVTNNTQKILIFHGNGFERIIQRTNASFKKPMGAIVELLEHRHLCPVFGDRTPVAPEWEDFLVINDIPQLFLAGHLHVAATDVYRGIKVCLGGTFLKQSVWLKRLGIDPTVGMVPIVNLSQPTRKTPILGFN